MASGKQVLLSFLLFIVTLLWFETTSTDIWLQDLLYNNTNHTWLLDTPSQVVNYIFYDGIKQLLVTFALVLLIGQLFFKHTKLVGCYQRGLRIVLLSLIIVPSVIGVLKTTTNVACPKDIANYDGNIPYIKLFENYPEDKKPEESQRCFPAGHASGGFALMSIYFLFNSRRNRRRGLQFGIIAGCIMGGYKMILGHHFLSHTISTMILAWILINMIVILDSFMAHRIKLYFALQQGSN